MTQPLSFSDLPEFADYLQAKANACARFLANMEETSPKRLTSERTRQLGLLEGKAIAYSTAADLIRNLTLENSK